MVITYKAIFCHNPEDYSLKFNLCGYLKSNINCSICSEESKGRDNVIPVLNYAPNSEVYGEFGYTSTHLNTGRCMEQSLQLHAFFLLMEKETAVSIWQETEVAACGM